MLTDTLLKRTFSLLAFLSVGSLTGVACTAGTVVGGSGTGGNAPYDPCSGKVCGATCTTCDPNDPSCVETEEVKVCDDAGACVSGGGAVACSGGGACDGKACGEECAICPVDDPDCAEPYLGYCSGDGSSCSLAYPVCEYVPCGDKACGEQCTICDPTDPSCVEDASIKVCDATGACVSDTGAITCSTDACEGLSCGDACAFCSAADPDCPEPVLGYCSAGGNCSLPFPVCDYDSCAGKDCGDPCTICDPSDPTCVETGEQKVCDATGACVSDTGAITCE